MNVETIKADGTRRVVVQDKSYGYFTIETSILITEAFLPFTIRFGIFGFGWPSQPTDPQWHSLN